MIIENTSLRTVYVSIAREVNIALQAVKAFCMPFRRLSNW
jgi:hypothetical protein